MGDSEHLLNLSIDGWRAVNGVQFTTILEYLKIEHINGIIPINLNKIILQIIKNVEVSEYKLYPQQWVLGWSWECFYSIFNTTSAITRKLWGKSIFQDIINKDECVGKTHLNLSCTLVRHNHTLPPSPHIQFFSLILKYTYLVCASI